MKKNLFILLAVVCVPAFAITCNAGAKKTTRPAMPAKKTVVQKNVGQEVMHPVKAVVSQLGNMATEAIFNPTKVTLYQLAGRDTVKKDEVEVEPHFVRERVVGTLSKDYIKLVQYLLVNDTANYAVDTVKVRSPYMPQIEMEFANKKGSVSVLVSTSDFTWTLISDGKKQFNYNYAEKSAINRLFSNLLKQD